MKKEAKVFQEKLVSRSLSEEEIEIAEYLFRQIVQGRVAEFVIAVETKMGSQLSLRSPGGKRLAGRIYRSEE